MTKVASSARRFGSTIRNAIVVRNRSFGLLWTGQLLSGAGSWLLLVAVPVHVFRLTGSASAAGLVSAAEVLPLLVVGPFAGVFADRWPRRHLMVGADLLAASCICLLVFVSTRGWVWLALVAVAAENCCAAFFGPACSGLVPAVVGRGPDLERANAWSAVSRGVVRLTGAPLGSALYALAGFRLPVCIDAASYLASAMLILLMRGPPATGGPRRAPARMVRSWHRIGPGLEAVVRGIAAEQRAGVAALLRDRLLRVLLAASALWLLGNGALTALLVPYVVVGLRAPAARVGELFTALGAGYLLSGVAGRRACATARLRVSVAALLAAEVLAFAGLFDWHQFAAALVFIGLAGLAGGAFSMVEQTVLQRHAPDHLIGRISGAYSTVVMAATLAGMLLASLGAQRLGQAVTRNLAIGVIGTAAVVAATCWPSACPGTSQPEQAAR